MLPAESYFVLSEPHSLIQDAQTPYLFWEIPVLLPEETRTRATVSAIASFIADRCPWCARQFCELPRTDNGIIVVLFRGAISSIIAPEGSVRYRPTDNVSPRDFFYALMALLHARVQQIGTATQHMIIQRDVYGYATFANPTLELATRRPRYQSPS